jgi:hypothetical protein
MRSAVGGELMLPDEAAELVDGVVQLAIRVSQRECHREILAEKAEVQLPEVPFQLRSILRRAYEGDLERRAQAIATALKRVLSLGMIGSDDAIGETMCVAFRERFERQLSLILNGLHRNHPTDDLGSVPETLCAGTCAELRLSALEHLRRVRPPMPPLDLLPEQNDLVIRLVEASRRVPIGERRKFWLSESHSQIEGTLDHPGLERHSRGAYRGDIEELGSKGLLNLVQGPSRELTFDVRPEGFRYYSELQRSAGTGVARLERVNRSSLDTPRFRKLYPEAYERWSRAEARLWQPQAEAELTAVGLLLRECLQHFATALVDRFKPPDVKEDRSKDHSRVRSVLAMQEEAVGQKTWSAVAESWQSTSKLVQRLVHGAERQDRPLRWEDARRAVFLVVSAMVQIDWIVGDPASN